MNTGEDNRRERLWAIFCNEEEGYSNQVSDWMPKENARTALTTLQEDGEMTLFLVAEDG